MPESIEVSVIVPVLNCPFVSETIESLLKQTYCRDRMEILIVGYDEPIRRYEGSVRFITTDHPSSAAEGRNIGIKAARGRYLCFIDGDCLADARWLERLVARLQEGHGIVGGAVAFNRGNYWAWCDNICAFSGIRPDSPAAVRTSGLVASANLAVSRKAIETFGMFNEAFQGAGVEDEEFVERCREHNAFAFFEPEARVQHRQVRSSLRSMCRHAYRYGLGKQMAHAISGKRMSRRHDAWLWRNRYLMVISSPLQAAVSTIKDIRRLRRARRRMWEAALGIWLFKMAWHWGVFAGWGVVQKRAAYRKRFMAEADSRRNAERTRKDGSTRRPRIAVIMPGFGVTRRGTERRGLELFERLSDRYEFTVFCRRAIAPYCREIKTWPAEHWLPNRLYRIPWTRKIMNRLALAPMQWEWASASSRAAKLLESGRFDLIIPHTGHWGAEVANKIRGITGTPWIYIQPGAPCRWMRWVINQRPDIFIASLHTYGAQIRSWDPSVHVTTILAGVDMERFNPAIPPRALRLERPVFLCVAALEPVKRVELTIRAVARRVRGGLLLIGDGPEIKRLTRLGAQLLGPKRFLHRVATPEDMPAYYTAADVFTMASESEALGNVYLEAMAANRPVVTQDDVARREVIGDAGVFCECTDIVAYAQALDLALSTSWGDRPRRQAQAFDWSKGAQVFDELFRGVIERSRARNEAGKGR